MATVNGELSLPQKVARGASLTKSELGRFMIGSNMLGQIKNALPTHLKQNAERYMRQVLTLYTQNPALENCSGASVLLALMTASSLGLDLSPQLGQCYILPYTNSKKINGQWVKVTEAQFQLGYRGVIALAQRSGEITRITAEIVHEKDTFHYSKGLHPVLEHEESGELDPGSITYVYAVANFKNGGFAFEVWPVGKVEAHARKFSRNYVIRGQVNERSPWATNFESMAKKTLIMALWKYLPLSTELLKAEMSDGAVKTDMTNLQTEDDALTTPALQVEAEPDADTAEPEPPIDVEVESQEGAANDEPNA